MRSAILGVVLIIILGSSAAFANLITNGGFETGDFTGWTVSGSGSFNYGITTNNPIFGTYAAWFGRSNIWTYISQDIPTIIGQDYDVSFWYLINNKNLPQGSQPVNAGEFTIESLSLQGSNVLLHGEGNNLPNTNSNNHSWWAPMEGRFTATTDWTRVEFGFSNQYGWWNLDGVSVDPVPEPSTFILLGLGVAALTACLGKHRRM